MGHKEWRGYVLRVELTLGSLFDGIAGFPLSASHCGIVTKWASEIEAFPIKVSSEHFPDMKHLGDVSKVNGAEVEPVDIISFGSPCQDMSVAGKREGLGGARSGLFMEAVRIIKEMRIATNGMYPRFAIWENVPGAFSSNNGHDFRTVLEEITEAKIPIPRSGRWAEAGMVRGNGRSVAWRVLDAQYWGVPQRRKRIFLITDFRGECAGEILFERESLLGHPEKSGEAWEEVAGSVGDGTKAASRISCTPDGIQPIAYSFDSLAGNSMKSKNPNSGCHITTISKTLDTAPPEPSKNQGGIAILQPIPINDKATRHIGGGSTRNHDGSGNGLGVGDPGDPCPTLTAGDEHYSLVCLQPTYAFSAGNSADARSIGFAEELSPTLKGSAGGNTVPVIAKPTYAIRTAQTSSNGWGLTEEISYTLDLASGQAVAYPDPANTLLAKANLSFRGDVDTVVAVDVRNLCETEELSGTLQSKNTGGYSLNYQNTVRIGYRVRRLTPTECLRLQGFPDNWLDIERASDLAKYKAVGNSVAIPCVEFVFSQIVKVLNRKEQQP